MIDRTLFILALNSFIVSSNSVDSGEMLQDGF